MKACETCGATLGRTAKKFCSHACHKSSLAKPKPPCERCGRPCARLSNRGRRVRFCSQSCYSETKSEDHRAAVIEDTEFLLSVGEIGPNIARRLGYVGLDSLQRALQKWGHHDLAARCTDEWALQSYKSSRTFGYVA